MARRKAGEAVPVVGPECTWLLEKMAASVTVPRRTAERAAIFLAAAGRTDRSIASEVGRSRDTVSRWRRRFAEAAPSLMAAEESFAEEGADRRTTLRAPGESLEMLLDDLPRAGAPPKYGPEARARVVSMACNPPKDHGVEATTWSLPLLAHAAIEEGVVESISPSTVGRFLREVVVRPHKSKAWLHSKDEDPEAFEEKVRNFEREVYEYAAELRESGNPEGARVVSLDEATGIQTLERLHPTRLPLPGQAAKVEFEYKRHGTTCLTGAMDVVGGTVHAPFLRKTRTEADFGEFLEGLLGTDPGAEWVLAMDNLVTHGGGNVCGGWSCCSLQALLSAA